MDARETAQEILRQLKVGDIRRFYSWGANGFAFDEDTKKGEIYLQFKVNGAIFKGKVRIALVLARDTYRIEFYQGFEKKKEMDDVYAEDMAEFIDEFIEKPANVTNRTEYVALLKSKKEPFINFWS